MDRSMDRIDRILLSLVFAFVFLIPLPYYIYTYVNNVYFVPYWTGIIAYSQVLGGLALLAWGMYRLFKWSRRAPR
jgi:hypothetical protein